MTASAYVHMGNDVIKAACQMHDISIQEVTSRSRAYRVTFPRQEAMAAMYLSRRWSCEQIGRMFGRDHTTVVHANKVVRQRMAEDPEIADRIEKLRDIAGERHFVISFPRAKVGFRTCRDV